MTSDFLTSWGHWDGMPQILVELLAAVRAIAQKAGTEGVACSSEFESAKSFVTSACWVRENWATNNFYENFSSFVLS